MATIKSIEEKAKAYDEKLDVARHIYADPSVKEEDKYYIEVIFPELAENKDKRIREWLIDTIKSVPNDSIEWDVIDKSDVLAWLEKQGKHAKFRDSIQVGDKVTRNQDGVLVNLSQLNRVAKKDEKQGEQRPFVIIPKFRMGDEIKTSNEESLTITKIDEKGYWSEDLFICGFEEECCWDLVEHTPAEWEPQTGDTFRKKGTTSPTYHLCDKREDGITFGFVENREVGIAGGEITIFALRQDYELVERPKSIEDAVEEELNKGLQTKVEQNPAWSEEDEKEVAVLKAYIRSKDWSERHIDRALGIVDELVNKVKSLRPQKSAEWSEENERCLANAIDACEQMSDENYDYSQGYIDAIDWLKSLKGRYTWKPSDEQMKALCKFIDTGNTNAIVLESLYDELKKLKA